MVMPVKLLNFSMEGAKVDRINYEEEDVGIIRVNASLIRVCFN